MFYNASKNQVPINQIISNEHTMGSKDSRYSIACMFNFKPASNFVCCALENQLSDLHWLSRYGKVQIRSIGTIHDAQQ